MYINFFKNPTLYKYLAIVSCSASAYFSISHATSAVKGIIATLVVGAFILMVEFVKNLLPAHAIHNKELNNWIRGLFAVISLLALAYSIFASSGFLMKVNKEMNQLKYQQLKTSKTESEEKLLLEQKYNDAKKSVEDLKKSNKEQIKQMQDNNGRVPESHSSNIITLNKQLSDFIILKNEELKIEEEKEALALQELNNFNNVEATEYQTAYTEIYTSIANYFNKNVSYGEPYTVEQVEFYVSLFCSILGELSAATFSYLYFSMRAIKREEEIIEEEEPLEEPKTKDNKIRNFKLKNDKVITNKIGFKPQESRYNFKESITEYLVKAEEMKHGNELPDVIKLENAESKFVNEHLKRLGIIESRNNKDYLIKQPREYKKILGL